MDYTNYDVEMFINLNRYAQGVGYGDNFDYLDAFEKDYETFGLGTYVKLTDKYPQFKEYLELVYASSDKGE